MALICYSKRIQISKGKRPPMGWRPPRGDQEQVSKGPVPGKSHRLCLITQHWVLTAPVKYCLPGKPISDSASGVSLGLVTQKPATGHVPKFQTPGMQAGVQQKLSRLHSLGTVSHTNEGMVETLPERSSQRPAKGQGCQQAFQREWFQACCVNSYLHTVLFQLVI